MPVKFKLNDQNIINCASSRNFETDATFDEKHNWYRIHYETYEQILAELKFNAILSGRLRSTPYEISDM